MKNFARLSFAVIMFSALAFTSCKKDETTTDPTPTPSGTTFTFAAVGHQWIMSNDSAGVDLGNDTTKIIAAAGANRWEMSDGSIMYCSSNEFGFTEDTLTMIICKADAKVNDQYTINIAPGYTAIAKVVAVDQSVVVPAGTFSCFKVDLSFMGQVMGTYYISRKYGMIKTTDLEGFTSKLVSKNFS